MPEQQAVLNWSELGNTRVGEVEPPKQIPVGHYSSVITGAGKVDNVGQNKTLCITYPIRLNEPMSDVDADEFAASDGFSKGGYELSFYLTPASLYRYTEFGKALGASDDMSVPEMSEFLANCGEEFVVEVSLGTSKKGRQFLQIDNPISMAAYNEESA
jgi:hypothetical protein